MYVSEGHSSVAALFITFYSFRPYSLLGALIPSLRRTDKLGDRFTEDQIDAILENFQNVLLGLQQAPGAGGGDAIGQEMDGMGEGEEDVVDSSGIQEDDDL